MKEIKLLFKANDVYLKYLIKFGKLMIFMQIINLLLGIPINLLHLYAPKRFLDAIIVENSLQQATLWIIIFVIATFSHGIIGILFNRQKTMVTSKAKLSAKTNAIMYFQKLYLSYFENNENMNIVNRAMRYADDGGNAFFNQLIQSANIIISLATVTFISFTFDWWLGIVIILVFIIKIFVGNHNKKIDYEFNKNQINRERINNYYSSILTQKNILSEVKIYNSMGFYIDKYQTTYIKNLKMRANHVLKMSLYGLSNTAIDKILLFVCYMLIGIKLLNKEATVGDYALFFSMIGQMNFMLEQFKNMVNGYYEQTLNAKNYLEFIEKNNDLMNYEENSDLSYIDNINSIELRNLTFRYNNQLYPALHNVSLIINKGEKISLVGMNGAGKSTLIKLILSLYKPESGDILINGVNISNFNFESYWDRIGVVFQNYNIYAISVAENILFAKNEDKKLVWEALKSVGLKDKIKMLPKKDNTMLSQDLYFDGLEFSSGENQRIAIARALAKKADFYIFDEPSSSLDAKSEDQLFNIIKSIPNDKTVIFISHRLSSVSLTDRIIVIDKGVIIGDGSHNELMLGCHEYKDMYETQARRYGTSERIVINNLTS